MKRDRDLVEERQRQRFGVRETEREVFGRKERGERINLPLLIL